MAPKRKLVAQASSSLPSPQPLLPPKPPLKTLFSLFTSSTLPLLVLSSPSPSQLAKLHSSLSALRAGAASWNASYCALPSWATDLDDEGAQEARCAWHKGCEEGCEAFLRLRELEGLCCALLAGMEGAASGGKKARLDPTAAKEALLAEAELADVDVRLYWEQHPYEDRLQGAPAYLVFWGDMSRLVLDCKKATTALAIKLVAHKLREHVLESLGESRTIRGVDGALLEEEKSYGEAGVFILVLVRMCVDMVRKLRGVEERKKGQTILRTAEYILGTKELAPELGEGVWAYQLDREILKAEISLLRVEMEHGFGVKKAGQAQTGVKERDQALSALKVAKEAKEDPASEVATVQSELAVESLDSAVAVVEGTGKEPVVVAKC